MQNAMDTKIDKLLETSVAKLQGYLDGNEEAGDEIEIAMKSANMAVKYHQTLGAREALRFAMAQAITQDPETLKRYVDASEPTIKRALTGKV